MNVRLRMTLVSTLSLVVALFGLLIFVPTTQAYVSSGSTPSGGGGSYYTTNGFGWYSYDINASSGPEAWGTGGPWAAAQAICRAEGASRIDAFIIQRSGGGNSGDRAKVYVWETAGYSTGWPGYKGNNGGNWMSIATAQGHFNSIPPSGRQGYTFGVNVAWFCYNGYNHNLTPTITGTPTSVTGSGSSTRATLSPSVNNTGTSSSSNNIQWRIVNFRVAPGGTVPAGGTSGTIPEQFFGNGATLVASAQNQTFPRNVTNLSVAQQPIGDYPIGTRICYALSVQPMSASSTNWRHSTPFCIIVAKSPKVQVRGGDIRVGSSYVSQTAPSASNIVTSQTVKNR